MKALLLLLSALLAVSVTAGCARTQARAVLEPPRLEVPAPPPRAVENVEVALPSPPAPEPEAEAEFTPVEPAVEPARPSATRADVSRGTEAPKAAAPPEPAGPKQEEAKAPPLQVVPAEQEGRIEAEVRTMLRAAESGLNRIDYGALGTDARFQYNQAKGFVQEAETHLKAKNLTFARILADKAATLAAQLSKR